MIAISRHSILSFSTLSPDSRLVISGQWSIDRLRTVNR